MTVGIISHEQCLLHEMGRNHPESPKRLDSIMDALTNVEFSPPLSFYQAIPASYQDIILAHDPEYVDSIIKHSPTAGYYPIDPDTIMNPYTLKAAFLAAGAVIQGVDLVMENTIQQAFCNVRPPGHHAEHNKAMGFCFFNNVAIGVAHAFKKYPLKKIAIVDFDVHHGNGTEDIIKDNENVLFCSSYEYPFYPFSAVIQNNLHLIHLPLPRLTSGEMFRKGVREHFLPALTAFSPDFIFISAGFDAHYADPLADLKLNESDYFWITKEIANIAQKCCQGRIVSSLEGGYNLEFLGKSVVAHIQGFF